jgi:hypothetical protein
VFRVALALSVIPKLGMKYSTEGALARLPERDLKGETFDPIRHHIDHVGPFF